MKMNLWIIIVTSLFIQIGASAEIENQTKYIKVQKFTLQQQFTSAFYYLKDGRGGIPQPYPGMDLASNQPEVHEVTTRIDGFLRWVEDNEPNKIFDVVFEKYLKNNQEQNTAFTARVTIDFSKEIPFQLKIDPQEKTTETYDLIVSILDDLLLMDTEKKLTIKEVGKDPEGQPHHKLIYTSKPIEKGFFEQWEHDFTRKNSIESPSQMDGLISLKDPFNPRIVLTYYLNTLADISSCIYEYDPESQMPYRMEKSRINYITPDLRSKALPFEEMIELLKKKDTIGTRSFRSIVLSPPKEVKED